MDQAIASGKKLAQEGVKTPHQGDPPYQCMEDLQNWCLVYSHSTPRLLGLAFVFVGDPNQFEDSGR